MKMYNYIIPFKNYELDIKRNHKYNNELNTDKIAGKNNRLSKDNLIEQVLKDNLTTIKTILLEISKGIEDRYYLGDNLIKDINEYMCLLNTKLFEVKDPYGGRNPSLEKRRISIENKICELNKEIRDRETERWRDIEVLRKEFRNIFIEHRFSRYEFPID